MRTITLSTSSKGTGVVDSLAQPVIQVAGINGLESGYINNVFQVWLRQQEPLTEQLTSITYTEPSTPDYTIQDLTLLTPYGFKTKDEGNTVLKVIANLQTRVSELESRLQSAGLL